MPVELSDLLGNERWVNVEVYDTVIRIAYRPSATSMRRQAELQRISRQLGAENTDEMAQVEQVAQVFCQMVTNWDLTRQGQPLPITIDIVLDLPAEMFNAMITAVGNDAQTQREEKKLLSVTSAAGLPREAQLANVQNGISPSEPRGTWA